MNYGVPYKGSKNRIVNKLVDAIPYVGVANFYDIFAGGCAVTHKMMLENRYKHYYANDIDRQALHLFQDAINGKYHDEKRWISREDFLRLKGSDPYVAVCWSFGNNQRDYLYSREIEPWKKALHYARVLGDGSLLQEMGIVSDGSRKDIMAHHEEYKQKYIKWWLEQQKYSAKELDALIAKCKGEIAAQEEELRQYLLRGLESSGMTQAEVGRRLGTQMAGHYFGRSQWEFPTQEYYEKMQAFMPALDKDYNEVVGLTRLWQSLQRLESLQSLQRLQSLQSSFKDYREVEIKPGSVVYCDPPYKGTDGYGNGFNHEQFYDWCCQQTELVLISEYSMPSDRFTEVWRTKHNSCLSATANNAVVERLFVPTRQLAMYKEIMRRQCLVFSV